MDGRIVFPLIGMGAAAAITGFAIGYSHSPIPMARVATLDGSNIPQAHMVTVDGTDPAKIGPSNTASATKKQTDRYLASVRRATSSSSARMAALHDKPQAVTAKAAEIRTKAGMTAMENSLSDKTRIAATGFVIAKEGDTLIINRPTGLMRVHVRGERPWHWMYTGAPVDRVMVGEFVTVYGKVRSDGDRGLKVEADALYVPATGNMYYTRDSDQMTGRFNQRFLARYEDIG